MSQQEENAVVVDNLSKSFRIPLDNSSGVKQALVNFHKRQRGYRDFHVLDKVSFSIQKGEFFGILGRNGSGKSTLLKLLAGIYTPNAGAVHVQGSLTPFIELGVGFNPELTARENVFLNGALLGFSREEMNGMYDEIVEFAELGDFMMEKLKNFSSGMQVRLAFSIAIKSNSDILLFDEVLAVGDSDFQQKCFNYFRKIKEEQDRTVILVTHDMSAVQKFCTRALVMNNGEVVMIGDPKDAAITYQAINFPEKYDEKSERQKVDLILANQEDNVFKTGDTLELKIVWDKQLKGVENIGVAIMSSDESYVFGTNTIIDKIALPDDKRELIYKAKLNLGSGTYTAKAAAFGETGDDTIFFNNLGLTFHVKEDAQWGGLTYLDHEWVGGKQK